MYRSNDDPYLYETHLHTRRNDPEFDAQAMAYAASHGLPMTAGSDIHCTNLYSGMAFRRRPRSGEHYLLTNGDSIFWKNGKRIL